MVSRSTVTIMLRSITRPATFSGISSTNVSKRNGRQIEMNRLAVYCLSSPRLQGSRHQSQPRSGPQTNPWKPPDDPDRDSSWATGIRRLAKVRADPRHVPPLSRGSP